MSSTLSREAANQSQSGIKKVRPGVYELLPAALVNPEIGSSHRVGARVCGLIPRLKCSDELTVLTEGILCSSSVYGRHELHQHFETRGWYR